MKRLLLPSCIALLLGIQGARASEVFVQAQPVALAPATPDDPNWAQIPAQAVSLMPQRIVIPHGGGAAQSLKVKALYDKRRLALLLEWNAAKADDLPSAAEAFTDACAAQMPVLPGGMPSPFMGDKDNPVVIWRWSASAQKDIDEGRQPRTKSRPYMAWDQSPALEKAAETLPGEKAGNVLSRRDRKSPVEFLGAKGYGTLTAFQDEPVQGKGIWRNGVWQVVFLRELAGEPPLKPGMDIPIAFAVWDGGAGERNGMKSVSVWHRLALGKTAAKASSDPIARGRFVFERYGCAACHGPGGKGGIKNPNAQGGQVPPINRVKEGFSVEELKKVIWEGRASVPEDARGPLPPLHMNSWKVVMDEKELDDLVKHLFSLMPKEKGQEW